MAWRIADHIVRGDIDNRLPGIIKGTLYLEGLREPLLLELEGNCDPDPAGRHLTFRNLMPQTGTELEHLCPIQSGTAGTMSANRMVRLPTLTPEQLEICLKERNPIPTRWSESLYLEWFGPNGRVLVDNSQHAAGHDDGQGVANLGARRTRRNHEGSEARPVVSG